MQKEDYNFQKLTPIDNVDLKTYEDALDFVFSQDDIKNIAISGPYSSGKSSIIQTYKKNKSKTEFLNISLTCFGSNDSRSTTDETKDPDDEAIDESILEGKILNQLIHQIKSKDIPQTKFKLKKEKSDIKTLISSVIVVIFLVLLMYIFFFDRWSSFVESLDINWLKNIYWIRDTGYLNYIELLQRFLTWTTTDISRLLGGLFLIVIIGVAIYTLIRAQKNKNIFKRLNLKGNQIEMFDESDDSCFDKYLNEVLYLFEHSGVTAIVFEDMDRYNMNQIFVKLREVNTLINIKRKKNNKKKQKIKEPLRFIYLLRDDVFISKDRTKFFDFIIPIVPVIDGSNSYEKFLEVFEAGIFKGLLNKKFKQFLYDLSLYIDDMRILLNVYNEFIVYDGIISASIELNKEKLLAIITYKNIFPKDFSDLQLGRGYVYTLFEKADEYRDIEVKKIDEQIKELEDKVKTIKYEMLDSVDELDALYLFSKYSIVTIDGKHISEYETIKERIKALKESSKFQHYLRGTNNLETEIAFEEINNHQEYIKRKEIVEAKSSNGIKNLEEQIEILKKKKTIIRNKGLSCIIKNKSENTDDLFDITYTNDVDKISEFKDVKGSLYYPLIKYLIRNGYIEEDYSDYINNFYEKSISKSDKNFLLSITNEESKGYSYSLNDPEEVLSKLNEAKFDQEEILNFNLLCYILKTESTNYKYLKRLIDQIVDKRHFDFIGEFLANDKETEKFIKAVNKIRPDVYNSILTESEFTEEQKKQYAILTLYYSSDEEIEVVDEKGCLSDYISNNNDFLNIENPKVDKIISGLSLTNVSFKWINYKSADKELFNAVYKNNLYQLTFEFICLILKEIYNLEESKDFHHKNYTLLSSRQEEALVEYVNKNIEEYVSIILDNCKEKITDDDSAALEILNYSEEELSIENKKEYLRFLKTKVEHIDSVIDEELWNSLLQEKVAKYSENNILKYFFFEDNRLNSHLIEFINAFDYEMTFDNDAIEADFGEDSSSRFFLDIVNCNELNNERYEMFIASFNMYISEFTYKEIEKDKMKTLIEQNVVKMTDYHLKFMREHYKEQIMLFITHNISGYCDEVLDDENFDKDEMILLLNENIPDKYKLKLLEFTIDKISIRDKDYSDEVNLHIITNNLDQEDISFLLESYLEYGNNMRNEVIDIVIRYFDEIYEKQYDIPFELLVEIFKSEQLEMDDKMYMFALHQPKMDVDNVKEALEILKQDDYLALFNLGRRTFEKNEVNNKILKSFKNKNWITSYDIDANKPGYYRAIGRRVLGDKKNIS